MTKKCIIPSCENTLSNRARCDECQACRSMFRYWLKKPPIALKMRQQALQKGQDRMVRLIGVPGAQKLKRVFKPIQYPKGKVRNVIQATV